MSTGNERKGVDLTKFLANRGAKLLKKEIKQENPINNKDEGVEKTTPVIVSGKDKKLDKPVNNVDKKNGKKTPTKPILEKPSLFKVINADRIVDPLKLFSFINWLAIPAPEREIKTQKELSVKMGIDEGTLVDWKKIPSFWDEVALYRTQYFRKFTSTVYFGLKERAKTGDPKAVELYAALFENYKKKIGILDETPHEINPATRDLINTALKHIGLAAVMEAGSEEENGTDKN